MATLEQDWQRDVIALARTLGWRVAHFRPAQTSKGWRTPVSADGKGFPDLILVRDRVIAAELKNERNKVTPEQNAWLVAFRDAGVEAHVWRPDDLEAVMATLLHRERREAA